MPERTPDFKPTSEQSAARAEAEADVALMQASLRSKRQASRNKHWGLIVLAAAGIVGLLMMWLGSGNKTIELAGAFLANVSLGLVSFWLFARLLSLRNRSH